MRNGIPVVPLPANCVIEDRVHDVPDFCLAAVGEIERTQPLFDGNRFDILQPVVSPARQNPLPEVALVRFAGCEGFVRVFAQFLFTVVFDKRLNTNRFEAEARTLSVDVDQKRRNSPFRRCLVRILFHTSDNQAAAFAAAVGKGFVPAILPCTWTALALRKLEVALLIACPSHFFPISRVVRRHG